MCYTTCTGEQRRKMACEETVGRILFSEVRIRRIRRSRIHRRHSRSGGAFCTRLAPPPPEKRRHSKGDVDQLRRRRGSGVLCRGAGLVEDLEDLVLAGVDPGPPLQFGLFFVAAGEGVVFFHSNAASESLVYAGMLLVSCQTSSPTSVPRRARLTCDGKWVKPTYQLL